VAAASPSTTTLDVSGDFRRVKRPRAHGLTRGAWTPLRRARGGDSMLKTRFLALVPLAVALGASASLAASAKTYQVTGPVVSVSPDMIVVMKGKDKWELGRDSATKMTAEPKVGDKVTIEYRMVATSVEAKAAPAPKAKKK